MLHNSKLLSLALLTTLAFSVAAQADFQRWSHEKESDPFTGGQKVTVDYMDSLRSGVLITCDTAGSGLTVRAIPGFDFDRRLEGYSADVSFAIDGNLILSVKGATGAVGNNLAAVDAKLTHKEAETFIDKFALAKKQIAIKDGIADKPHLLTARSSTESGRALQACLKAQGTDTDKSETDKIVQLKQSQLMELYKIAREGIVEAHIKNGADEIQARKAGAETVVKMLEVVE